MANKCSKHPKYAAKRYPASGCLDCLDMWMHRPRVDRTQYAPHPIRMQRTPKTYVENLIHYDAVMNRFYFVPRSELVSVDPGSGTVECHTVGKKVDITDQIQKYLADRYKLDYISAAVSNVQQSKSISVFGNYLKGARTIISEQIRSICRWLRSY